MSARKSKDTSRALADETANELLRNLGSLFSDGRSSWLTTAELESAWPPNMTPRVDKKVIWCGPDRSLLVPLVDPATAAPNLGVKLEFKRDLDAIDLDIANCFSRVFNGDVATAPKFHSSKELWLSLQQTRFSRAIGRYAKFHTDHFVHMLRTFENAGSLRYEGSSFATHLVLTKQLDWIAKNPALTFVKFSDGIPLERALFREKWIRALSSGGKVGLIALGHGNGIVGAVRVNTLSSKPSNLLAPHEELTFLCSALVPGTMALVTSDCGDLYVLFPDGAVFLKAQGRWHFLNYNAIRNVLSPRLESQVSSAILRLVLDLSYEKHGALFSVPDNPATVAQFVPDHLARDRSNRALRLFSRKLKISEPPQRQILKSIAAIDGAVVISSTGEVLDSACMISTPSDHDLKQANQPKLQHFPGARTTAAWNCSLHGLAIKVSEDGPITIFEKGNQVLQIG